MIHTTATPNNVKSSIPKSKLIFTCVLHPHNGISRDMAYRWQLTTSFRYQYPWSVFENMAYILTLFKTTDVLYLLWKWTSKACRTKDDNQIIWRSTHLIVYSIKSKKHHSFRGRDGQTDLMIEKISIRESLPGRQLLQLSFSEAYFHPFGHMPNREP